MARLYILMPVILVTALLIALWIGCSGIGLRSIAHEIKKVIAERGIDAAIEHYRELHDNHYDKYDFAVQELQNLGADLYENGYRENAIRILELNAKMFPDSGFVHYDLARICHYSCFPNRR